MYSIFIKRLLLIIIYVILNAECDDKIDVLYNPMYAITDTKVDANGINERCNNIEKNAFKAIEHDYLIAFYDPCFQDSKDEIWKSVNGNQIWLDAFYDGSDFLWQTSRKKVNEFPCGTNSINFSRINKKLTKPESIGLYLEFDSSKNPRTGMLFAGSKKDSYIVLCRKPHYYKNLGNFSAGRFTNCSNKFLLNFGLAENHLKQNPSCLKSTTETSLITKQTASTSTIINKNTFSSSVTITFPFESSKKIYTETKETKKATTLEPLITFQSTKGIAAYETVKNDPVTKDDMIIGPKKPQTYSSETKGYISTDIELTTHKSSTLIDVQSTTYIQEQQTSILFVSNSNCTPLNSKCLFY
jgi:hypothetical protein